MAKSSLRGYVLFEVLLAVGLAAVIGSVGLYWYGAARESDRRDETIAQIVRLSTEVGRTWKQSNSYATLNASALQQLQLVQPPLRWDGSNILDGVGNQVLVSGGVNGFVLALTSSSEAMSTADCAAAATRLAAAGAHKVSVGSGLAVAANGQDVTGNYTYKQGATLTQANLATGCAETSPRVFAVFY